MTHVRSILVTAVLALAPVVSLAAPGAAQAHPSGSRCHSFTDASGRPSTLCVKVLGELPERQREVYGSFIENDTDADRTGDTCTSADERTFHWAGTPKVTAGARRWLFARVAEEAATPFDRRRTAEPSVSASFTVPARSTRYCSYVERLERYDTVQCVTTGDGPEQCRHRVFRAPAREGWIISDGPVAS